MANCLARTLVYSSRVVHTSFTRTLVAGYGKSPMDSVKQGTDQLGQAAGKAKDALNSARTSVADAVSNDERTNKKIDDAKKHGHQAADHFQHAAAEAKHRFEKGTSKDRSTDCNDQHSSDTGTTTTEKILDKAGELAQQAKSTVKSVGSTAQDYASSAVNKAREVADDVACSAKQAANKAYEWATDAKQEAASDGKNAANEAVKDTRDSMKRGTDHVKSSTNKAARKSKHDD